MSAPLKVVLLEDSQADAALLLCELRAAGFELEARRVDDEEGFHAALAAPPDIIFIDYGIPGWSGLAALRSLRSRQLDVPAIIISGAIGEEVAVAAIRAGADDYLLKDRLTRLGPAVQHALEQRRLRREGDEAKAALRVAHAKLGQLLEHSPAVLYVLRFVGETLVPQLVSENIRRLLGVSAAEAARPNWWEFALHPHDRAHALASLRATQFCESWRTEYRLRHADGHYCWIEDAWRVQRDASGTPTELVGVYTDITERKRAEATQRLQSAALTAAANAIVITDHVGAVQWANPAFSRLTGYSLAESVGTRLETLVASGTNEGDAYSELWSTISAGGVWTGELINRRKDGSLYHEEQTITPVRDETGAITQFVAIKQDLTERKLVDEIVLRTRRQFRAVFEQAAVGMAVVDGRTSAILNVNPRFSEFIGSSGEDLRRRLWRDLIHPEDREVEWRRVEQLCARELHEVSSELRYLRADGVPAWGKMSATLMDDGADHVTLIVVVQDIGERKRAEQALMESEGHYRSLFENMLNAGLYGRLVYEGGEAVDFVVLAANRALERITGLTGVVGKLASELVPGIKSDDTDLLAAYARVSASGGSEGFEYFFRSLKRWFSISVYASARGHFVTMFDDITDRKLAELMLREKEQRYLRQRDAFVRLARLPHSSGELLPRLHQITEIAARTLNTGRVSIWRYSADRSELECVDLFDAETGQHEARIRLKVAEFPEYFAALEESDAIRADDALSDARTQSMAKTYLQPMGIGAMLDATVRVRGVVDGVLCHEHRGSSRTWERDEETFAAALANMVALALEEWQRNVAEDARRNSEERYRLLVENATDGIFTLTSTGVIASLNPAFKTITGWTPEEWVGRSFIDLIHPEDHGKAKELFALAMEGVQRRGSELRVRTASGGCRDVELSGFPNRRTDGSVEVQGIGRDVTERNIADRRLREQTEILSRSHECVVIVDLENRITFWNRGAEMIFGWSTVEAIGQPADRMLGVIDPAAVATLRRAVEQTGQWSGEMRAMTRSRRQIIAETRTALVRDERGRPRARISFIADATEKKQLEEKVLHAQRLESLGMLAAGIVHDLNNVLAPIMIGTPLLRERVSTPADFRLVDTLEASARRGAGLVKQILSFVQHSTGELRPTQVKHLARDVVGMIEETFPKSIQLEHHIPSDLWPVQASPTQIHQVLLNLCVNARDAMPNGGTLKLSLRNECVPSAQVGDIGGARPGDWIVLEVSDTGTGIAPEILEAIWTPFFTTKGPGRGTGLGLSTVRGIVEHHHGFTLLETAVGRGTTVRVYLPAAKSKQVGADSEAPFDAPSGNGELLLLVDDDAAVRETLATILRQRGYRVETCVDGLDAMDAFRARANEITMVITDVDMPRLGGLALAQTIRQVGVGVPVIAMSGIEQSVVESTQPPEQRGADAFLLKPFNPRELLELVRGMLLKA